MIYSILLVIHIAAGFTSLFAGLVAMIFAKGSRGHIRSGTVFYYSMLIIVFSAVTMSLLKFNVFLLTIGIFALFQNYSGRRALRNKSLKPSPTDWIVWAMAIANGLFMIYTLNPVLAVFGFISLFLASGQFMLYRKARQGKKITRKDWLGQHIGMMTGAYIATLTAFLVVNITSFQPWWLIWLAPTFVFVPLIVYWTRKFA